jgi:hypothetical protein
MSRRPSLKTIALDASRALARLETEHLEGLALLCEQLRHRVDSSSEPGALLQAEAFEAARPARALARVLEESRANLDVLAQLRTLGGGRLEYSMRRAKL